MGFIFFPRGLLKHMEGISGSSRRGVGLRSEPAGVPRSSGLLRRSDEVGGRSARRVGVFGGRTPAEFSLRSKWVSFFLRPGD